MLSEYGVDLAEWYAARRWMGLLDLIDMLPSACRLNEAIANDPESAEYLAEQRLDAQAEGGKGEEWSPPVAEFHLEHRMFQQMISLLIEIKQGITVQTGNKPKAEKPFPVPRTAIDRAIEAAEQQWSSDFIQQFGFDADDI